jgi:hypothetical protein
MEKSTNKTSQQPRKLIRHKLTLRREVIALLTVSQLSHVASGGTGTGLSCRTQSGDDCEPR